MKLEAWSELLDKEYGHRYPELGVQLLRGITHGVPIEFEGDLSVSRHGENHKSALDNIDEVRRLIAAGCESGKFAGPFPSPPMEPFSSSPLGGVVKTSETGVTKVRLVHDLSSPFGGNSINSNTKFAPLYLESIDAATSAIRRFGAGCLLVKLDVEAAYNQIPIDPADWNKVGFTIDGQFYFDRTLPFGLKSSCRLWDMYASALHFFFSRQLGIECVIHYVDDFLFVMKGPPQGAPQGAAEAKLAAALELCSRLGLPMAAKKTEGPITRLTFLGIEIDTVAMCARLSDERLAQLQSSLASWGSRTHATLTELESLTGVLNFAAKVVRPGRAFLRRIIARFTALRAKRVSKRSLCPIGASCAADIRWWQQHVRTWNGVSIMLEQEWTDASKLHMWTDACLMGYGAVYENEWLNGRWPDSVRAESVRAKRESMPYLELYALVLAAKTWGAHWAGRKIIFHCDCQPVVQALQTWSSAREGTQHLIRTLATTAAFFDFDFRVEHIAGLQNVSADALSRFDMSTFREQNPAADERMCEHSMLPPLPPQQAAAVPDPPRGAPSSRRR